MEAYQARMVNEKVELDGKIASLEEFLVRNVSWLDREKFALMSEQLGYMKNYSGVLGRRIAMENVGEATPTAA